MPWTPPSTLRKLFVAVGFGNHFHLRWLLQGPEDTHKGQICLLSPASFLATHLSNLLEAHVRDLSPPCGVQPSRDAGPAHPWP